jgi:signal peptidase I
MMLQVIKVSGRSLDPAYRDGDYVLVSGMPFHLRSIRPGDAVVFQHPRLGRLIKLVEHLEDVGNSVYVIGLDEFSNDSRIFGAIPRNRVEGKVIWHFRRR